MGINKFIYRSKYRYAKYLPLRIPVDVSLELAGLCNQSCGYCYWSDAAKIPFKPGIMPLDIGAKIINQAAAAGVNSIKFNWKGESTLNPNFATLTYMAKCLADGSTFIDRLTNSNFKFQTSREDIFEGLCNQTKVKVSFDSFIPEVMEKQRAGSIHTLAMKNIDYFYNHRKRKNTELVIQAVRTKLNKDEDIAGEVARRWPEAKASIRDMVSGRVEKDLSELENKKRNNERQSCIQAHARLIFDWQGDAYPCCVDIAQTMKLGSIKEHSLKEIFNSMEAVELRKALKNKTAFCSGACKTCSSFESYKGYKAPWGS